MSINRRISLAFLALAVSASASLAARLPNATGDAPEARRVTHALNILEAQGFAAGLDDKSVRAFRDFREQGKNVVATLSENGHAPRVTVDPDTGQAMQQD